MTYSGTNHLCNSCTVYGRKSCFLRWLGKIFKGSSGRAPAKGRKSRSTSVGEENMDRRSPARSVDGRSRDKDEDLDRAIAVSLAEDDKTPRGTGGDNAAALSDEELARALQEKLKMSTYPPYLSIGFCEACKRPIGYYNHYVKYNGSKWHIRCFRCHACGGPFQMNEEYNTRQNKPYHVYCYKALFHPRCDVCHEFFPTDREGVTSYNALQFWNQKYCPAHEHDNTPRCCSCERLAPRGKSFCSLGDGRSLCMECLEFAILDTGECQTLYHAIRDFYEGLNMKIDQQIPMIMVERQGLNEAIAEEKDGNHRRLPETRGLCLTEERTVSTIIKKPNIGGNGIMDVKTCPQKVTRITCEVTAILILYGLPRLLTGSILAHELMHAYLRLKGYRHLDPVVEEGICQIMSHMWLESEVPRGMASTFTGASSSTSTPSKKGRTSETEKKLGEFYIYQLATDLSPDYGGGFREANAAVNKYGLRRTLDHIRLTGHFPL